MWDDHDYGANDAGRDFKEKKRNRKHFLDFLDEPADSERRLQDDTPIHQDYIIKSG